MGSPQITNTEIKVIDLLCPILGVVITAVRLGLRLKSGLFWWDDALAFGSAIFAALMSAATWVHYTNPVIFSKTTKIVAYYGIAETFYIALWTARLSILYSILRIAPESQTRRVLNIASICFACVCAFLCAQVFWVCENKPHWKDEPQPQCALGLQVAVCQLITDVASDLLLIIIPIRLFAGTNLARGLKTRLLVIFSAAALTTIVSLVHAAFLLEGLGEQAIVCAIVEISVSLIVCNFVVVVPAFWRSCGVRDDSHSRERTFKMSTVRFAAPARRPQLSIGHTNVTISTVEQDTINVTGITHDDSIGVIGSNAEPRDRKARLQHSEDSVIDLTQKDRLNRMGNLDNLEDMPCLEDSIKNKV